MTTRMAPSRVTRALLRSTSSADAADAVIGDVIEELEQRTAAGHAPRLPQLWLELQVLRFAIAAARMQLLLDAGIIAAAIPARRATRLDPVVTLRGPG